MHSIEQQTCLQYYYIGLFGGFWLIYSSNIIGAIIGHQTYNSTRISLTQAGMSQNCDLSYIINCLLQQIFKLFQWRFLQAYFPFANKETIIRQYTFCLKYKQANKSICKQPNIPGCVIEKRLSYKEHKPILNPHFYLINYHLKMEPENFSILQLAQRQPGVVIKLPVSQKRTFLSNYYEIKLSSKNSSIFQFHFETTPEINQDSRQLLFQVVKSLKKVLKEKIGFITASGNMIWGEQNLKIPLTLKTQFKFEEITHKLDVLIKPTKSLNTADLAKTPDGLKMVFQVFNNKLKDKLRNRKMDQITRGKYFDREQVQVKEVGLNILRGFKFTLCKLNKGLTLQIDVCSKVLRSSNFLEQLSRISQDQAKNYVGATVITRYGRYRTFKITKIDYSQTAKSQFYHEKRAGKISYAKYYEENYGIKIKTLNQPLIEVVLRVQKKRVNNTIQKTEHMGFLIPQLVALTGMSDQQKSNFLTMKQIAPYTRLTPNQRIDQIQNIRQALTAGNDIRIEAPLKLDGFQLFEPDIKLRTQNYKPRDGSFRFKDSLKASVDPKDWVLVYSQGKNAKWDDNDADDFVDLLKEASKAFQIKVNDPGFITCGQNVNSWKDQINADVKKNGKPQIIALLVNPQEQRFYGQLKKFITNDLQLPCQFVRKRTVSKKQKNPLAAASMILIQMNQKMGGIAWQVQKKSEYFQKKKLMYGAFSISKGKRGFTLAFVGTLNSQCTRVISFCKPGYKNKDDIPKADFQTIFQNWAKNYVKQNKTSPQLIIVYRQGLSVPQIQAQVPHQIDALQKIIFKIGQKTKNENYRPQVVYLTVNKKINTRFFEETQERGSGGKFAPKAVNPASGSCIFEQLSVNLYDFHIASQKVTQGTCTPTQYIVVHNKSTITQESLAQFTFEQTFNYYNWQGAVKVPACMQCADKLATLVGESIQANVVGEEITKGFFFL